MSPAELQHYLHEHIPLSKAMQVTAVSVSIDSVLLRAPLEPNINHRKTAFGGSVSALAVLAAWSLLHVRLRAASVDCRLVIQRNTMDYESPIQGEFFARALLTEPARWESFLHILARKRKARVSVISILEHAGQAAGTFHGEFVALRESPLASPRQSIGA